MNYNQNKKYILVTAGSAYLDIDAYACMVAMAELMQLKGENAFAYSTAPCNYSVCQSLIDDAQILKSLPADFDIDNTKYIIVDVSDPDFLKNSVPLAQVRAVYDHHVGFEEYWRAKIGECAHIEFIGAAATLILREWERAGLSNQMQVSTAKLLIAAILDNTLNMTSSNTTDEDIKAFSFLCKHAGVGEDFGELYFSEVQKSVEADLKNALFGDMKTVRNNAILPPQVAQIAVWDACGVLAKLPEIQAWFSELIDDWMINIIDIRQRCSYFVCEAKTYQRKIEGCFSVCFKDNIAKTPISYLRKEIIKKTKS